MDIKDVGHSQIFFYPEWNAAEQMLEPKRVDFQHLFVNLRVKVSKGGLHGIKKEAWHDVAETDNSIISKAIVSDLIDKQNNAYARRTCSGSVEIAMRTLGFYQEAYFCKLVRDWFEAEDLQNTANEHCRRRLDLKNSLLQGVDVGAYAMPGMYVKGFPKVMSEALLKRIDTNIQLYSIVKTGSYKPRSICSFVNETFFGELSELEPTKLGCPKAVNIPRLVSVVTEIQHFRC